MAVDETVLKTVAAWDSPPTLRFYTWNPPAVSVGYFQDSLADIDIPACKEVGIDIVRRLTGGRAVLHDKELTYSLICREDDPHFPDSILGTYKVISYCLVKGLKQIGINPSLIPPVKRGGGPACFTSPSHYEITIDGQKLVGSAQRREKGAFIQHGSILLKFDKERLEKVLPKSGRLDMITAISEHIEIESECLIAVLVKGFEEFLGVSFMEGRLSKNEMALSERLLSEKYSRHEWNFKRPS